MALDALPTPEPAVPAITPPAIVRHDPTASATVDEVVARVQAEAAEKMERDRVVAAFRAKLISQYPTAKDRIDALRVDVYPVDPKLASYMPDKQSPGKYFLIARSLDGRESPLFFDEKGELLMDLEKRLHTPLGFAYLDRRDGTWFEKRSEGYVFVVETPSERFAKTGVFPDSDPIFRDAAVGGLLEFGLILFGKK